MEALNSALIAIVADDPPVTVRQVFYQAEAHGLVDKTENGYRRVQQCLRDLRIAGQIDWRAISDNSRSVLMPTRWTSPKAIIRAAADSYRRDFWQAKHDRPVIYVEKDALAGVIEPVTERWGVPLAVARGEASLSFKHDVAVNYLQTDTTVYLFTDLDGSGEDMERVLRRSFEDYFGVDAKIVRVALTPAQVKQYKLPRRPAKRPGLEKRADNRAWAVELDALPKAVLTELVEQCIRNHVDEDEWAEHEKLEQTDQQYLRRFVRRRTK